ncbi:MAG: hypothetical protein ACF8OB_01585 [Phycisphaeraceae bacterium JB051]
MNKRTRLKRVRKWIENKPPILVNFALEAATSIDETLWWLKYDINQKKTRRQIAIPDKKEWLKFYKKSFRVQVAACLFLFGYPRGIHMAWCFRDLRGMVHQAKKNPKRFVKRIKKMMNEIGLEKYAKRSGKYEEILLKGIDKNIEDNLESLVSPGFENDVDEQQFIDHLMRTQEMSFFIRVWFSCYFLHHMEPGIMLRKARQGDADMLVKLLRIDKMIIYDPPIQQQFIEMKYGPQKSGLRTFNKAFAGGPTGGINRKKVVKGIAHFVHSLFDAMGQKISVAEVKEFFDAIAAAKKVGCLNEADIASEQALKKALGRAEPWPAFQGQK